MKKHTVLFISHVPVMAGANHSLLQLMIELRERYSISPIVLGPHPENCEDYNIMQACKEHKLPYIPYNLIWFKYKECTFRLKIVYVIKMIMTLCRLYFIIRPFNISLIHTNTSVISVGVFLAKLLKVPHVFHLREYGDLDYGLHSIMGKDHDKYVYNQSDVCIAISQTICKHYQDIIDLERIRIIYNGIDSKRFSIISEHKENKVNFCVLGIVNEAKNQKSAIEAINVLIKRGYKQFHLYIIGNDKNEYAKLLKEYVNSNNIGDFVTFLGEIRNVPEVLSQMDVGLMLSSNEAFGRVTIEYMMQNIAVIASDRGANAELVLHKNNGLIYDYQSVDELVNSMAELIDNRDKLLAYASNGRNYALSKFSSERNSDEIFQLYKDLWRNAE